MTIEDRLRDALRATAGTVDDRPERPLPERSPQASPVRRRLVPLGAVAGVLALLAGFVAAQRFLDDPAPRLQWTPAMPRFVFASTHGNGGSDDPDGGGPYGLEVRESATGRLVDRFEASPGVEFGQVAALRDNRTFFVTSEPVTRRPCRTTVQRVSVSGGGRIIAMEPVAGGPVAGTVPGAGGLAVTPDGARMALAVEKCDEAERIEAAAGNARIVTADLATGARREWPDSGLGDGASNLSLTEQGDRLFFSRRVQNKNPLEGDGGSEELRVMNVSAPSGSLLGRDAAGVAVARAPRTFAAVLASPDGRSVITAEAEFKAGVLPSEDAGSPGASPGPQQNVPPQEGFYLLELSAQGGRVLRRIAVRPVEGPDLVVFKNDASGRYLLTSGGIVDLREDGRLRPLKGLDDVIDVDW
ncbi:hypothetical protein [Spirillospora sp. NPDC047279]|uniref:hypothetical protein n=1 Tax=Spirillospora sp. NPDC047279 TaxID=3155478 RepID=UPI0033FE2D99